MKKSLQDLIQEKRGKSGNGNSISLACRYCNNRMTLEEADRRGWHTECESCNANMHVMYDYDSSCLRTELKSAIERSKSPIVVDPFFFRISKLLPLQEETLHKVQRILIANQTLFPGSTELRRSKKYPTLHLKCEYQNPTGSFKDIGTICELSKAFELGFANGHAEKIGFESNQKTLHLASTGNMGISATYYANALRIPLVLHFSKNVNGNKIQKMKQFGLDSTFGARRCVTCEESSDGYDFAQNHVKELFCKTESASRMWIGDTTLRIEGCKTIAFEIFSQLYNNVPDNVIVPVGNGTLLCAIWKGFDELLKLELSDRMPRIYGVVVPEKLHKKVTALGVSRPGDLTVAFKIIRDTNGAILSLNDDLVTKGQESLLCQEGISAEPAGAISYITYERMLSDFSRANEATVALLTGRSYE